MGGIKRNPSKQWNWYFLYSPLPSWHHSDPCTKVQDSELKIAASARFLGTTTRQLELLAAPTAHALPNGLTRAGTLSAPPGQGEHSARSLRAPLFVEFLQEPYCTACFLGRPPTHSGRHSQSLELALPSVPRIQPSGLEANHMLALLLASEPRAHSSSSSTSLRPDPCSIREWIQSCLEGALSALSPCCSHYWQSSGLFLDGVNCQMKVKLNFFFPPNQNRPLSCIE